MWSCLIANQIYFNSLLNHFDEKVKVGRQIDEISFLLRSIWLVTAIAIDEDYLWFIFECLIRIWGKQGAQQARNMERIRIETAEGHGASASARPDGNQYMTSFTTEVPSTISDFFSIADEIINCGCTGGIYSGFRFEYVHAAASTTTGSDDAVRRFRLSDASGLLPGAQLHRGDG